MARWSWPDGIVPASLLYVPAGNERALARVHERGAEAVIVDLEDGTAPADRARARAALSAMLGDETSPLRGLAASGRLWLRVNVAGADAAADRTVLAMLPPTIGIVVPKVDAPDALPAWSDTGRPLLAMIETPAGVQDARSIAACDGVVGLIAGLNDLAHQLRLPPGAMRAGTLTALSLMVLAARAAGVAMFDGVWNAFGDRDGFVADSAIGRAHGCDGRTLIHPAQVEPCHAAYWPDAAAIGRARDLLRDEAASGAVRHGDAMVEDMHRDAARALIANARARGLYDTE